MDKATESAMNAEYLKILDETITEENARFDELKAQGRLPHGLDGDKKLFKDINDRAKKKIAALRKKYGVDKDKGEADG